MRNPDPARMPAVVCGLPWAFYDLSHRRGLPRPLHNRDAFYHATHEILARDRCCLSLGQKEHEDEKSGVPPDTEEVRRYPDDEILDANHHRGAPGNGIPGTQGPGKNEQEDRNAQVRGAPVRPGDAEQVGEALRDAPLANSARMRPGPRNNTKRFATT